MIHPRLTAGRRLGTVRDPDARAPILDREGRPLVTARRVVRIGLDRATVKDVDASAAALAAALHVDAAALASAAKRAGPKQFVEAVTLRAGAYTPALAQQVQAIQGTQAVQGTEQLAPTKSFAGAVLGTVAPATAEQIQRSKGKVGAGDDVGQFGLEARYQDQPGGHAHPSHRHPLAHGRARRDAAAAPRPQGARAAHHARPPRPGGRRAGARCHQAEGGADRRAALDGRRPGRRQPSHRGGL